MLYQKLGDTELIVSKICFGALGIGPLQANFSIDEGAEIIQYAFNRGINFIDTAEMYKTYPYIARALKAIKQDIIIATKSYAYTRSMMKESFEKARVALDRDAIDIFLLHEQENALTIEGHREALEYLLELKAKNKIKAVGISTHNVEGVKAASKLQELDVIHPLINIEGLGISDGTRDEMEKAIAEAIDAGKGIYTMKALGGGNLLSKAEQALEYSFSLPAHSVALGMKSFAEVDFNISYLESGLVMDEIRQKVKLQPRRLFIEDWCQKCGKCINRCSQGALSLASDCVKIDHANCVLCGYCASECTDFCIKIV